MEIEGMGELRLRGSLTLAQAGGGIGIEYIKQYLLGESSDTFHD